MSTAYLSRIQKFQKNLEPNQVVLISKPADIFYFTGFVTLVPEEREAYLLVTPATAELFHTTFSPVTQVSGVSYTASIALEGVSKKIGELGSATPGEAQECSSGSTSGWYLLLDYNSLFVQEFKALEKITAVTITQLNQQKIWRQRMVKDKLEIAAITKAATITQQAFQHILPFLAVGKTELEVAWELESFIKTHGGTLAFPTIIAYGSHAALPHHQPTTTALQDETAVLLDFGAKIDNYCSDMTRTLWFGSQPTLLFSKIEQVVTDAYDHALAVCKQFIDTIQANPGNTTLAFSEVDIAARKVLEAAGYEKNFIHTTGHGLGIEIHEHPSVYKTTTTLLEANMAFTIEPGIYLTSELGYRYENTILLTQTAVLELTK